MGGHALTDPKAVAGLGETRRRVLDQLHAAGTALGVQNIAERVGLHPNTARFHLDGLVEAGLAERQAEERSQPGRPRMVYQAAPIGTSTGLRSYRLLAEMLTSLVADTVPNPGPAALAAGQAWGRFLAQRPAPLRYVDADEAVQRLSTVLDDVGFAPGPSEREALPAATARQRSSSPATHGRRVISLRHCPFREIAVQQQEVVCSLHLGLIRGVLAEVRAPLDADRLDPFVQPSLCLAHLAPRDGEPGSVQDQASATEPRARARKQ